jgi:hypothetical protein
LHPHLPLDVSNFLRILLLSVRFHVADQT